METLENKDTAAGSRLGRLPPPLHQVSHGDAVVLVRRVSYTHLSLVRCVNGRQRVRKL